MKQMSNEQFVNLCELELQQHKQDLHAKMIKAIDDYMRVAGPGELKIICGEYEATIRRSE